MDRLSQLDASLLYMDQTAPGYLANLALFRPPARGGLRYEQLCRLVERSLPQVPRYRQKVKRIPGGLGGPVWVDDTGFDVTRHVRRSHLPAPGTMEQLEELVARVCARRLDQDRPLWEMYLVEGLADGRVGIISKTHEVLVDGAAVDLMQVLHNPGPVDPTPALAWRPAAEPTPLALASSAIGDLLHRPQWLLSTAYGGLSGAGRALSAVAGAAGDVLAAVRTAARPAPPSPLNVPISGQRRFTTLDTELSDYRAVRRARDVSVTDVVLAAVTGGLRGWLMVHGVTLARDRVLRAMVPVSVRAGLDDQAIGTGATRVSAVLVDLPVGEPNPMVRLHQIGYALHSRRQSGHFVRADRMIALSGFAPPTLHALGVKAVSRFSRRLHNLVVSNVPGPQEPLHLAGAQLAETYPVVPLRQGQALAIGVTSYHGGVYYGLNADRTVVSDLDVMADLIAESLAELVETSG
jgi:WS/DGAT/MGAT family acyltransferase